MMRWLPSGFSGKPACRKPFCGSSRSRRPCLEALEDRFLPTVYTVTTVKDILGDTTPGELTLRDALTAVSTQAHSGNAAAGTATNVIDFHIGTVGSVQTIVPTAQLPSITHMVVIDGWSQGGPTYDGSPLIVLSGASAGTSAHGLSFMPGSSFSHVRGLDLQQFNSAVYLSGVANVRIYGNYIGTDASGTIANSFGNAVGIFFDGGCSWNVVGGGTPALANVIDDVFGGPSSQAFGIYLNGPFSYGNTILGNRIGTAITGGTGTGSYAGIWITDGAWGNTVGGIQAADRNIVSGNSIGIEVTGASSSRYVGPDTVRNLIVGNLIGVTHLGGKTTVGNGVGVAIGSSGGGSPYELAVVNYIGAAMPGAGNTIIGNGTGVVLSGLQKTNAGNWVIGNRIDSSGAGFSGPGYGEGILIEDQSAFNMIGGSVPGAGNVITRSLLAGIEITDPGTTWNSILGNFIGTDQTRLANLGNGGGGVLIQGGATRNSIGGTGQGQGNVIAFNAKGVVVAGSTSVGDSIIGNAIYANTGLGIDLGDDGVTANGANPRSFPNDGQNTPVLLSTTANSVTGSLTSVAGTRFRLEFFISPPASNPYDGVTFIGANNVMTNASGMANFTAPVLAIPAGAVVSATATNLSLFGTSEFVYIDATRVVLATPPAVMFSPAIQLVTLNAQVFFGNTAVATGQVTYTIQGLPGSRSAAVGSAVNFPIHAATPRGRYVITATYAPTGFYGGSSATTILIID
jgi:hypothetical protein